MKFMRNLIAILGTLVMCACNDPGCKDITFMHYNVGAFHKYDSSSVEAVVRAVRETRADIISLNEVDSCTTRTGSIDQLSEFARKMGNWNSFYASAIPYKGGAYGVGVSSSPRYEIVRTEKIPLHKFDGKEARVVALVEYEDFVFASTHLDLTYASQMGQINQINHYVDSLYSMSGKPVILCGDFNCEPDSEQIKLMKDSWIMLSPEEFTYPSYAPIKCIDYVFVRPNGRKIIVEHADVVSHLETVVPATASDHLSVVVRLTIK